MTHGTGFIPDPTGHRWTPFRAIQRMKATAAPRPVQFAAPVSDQMIVGQCVAHGVGDAAYVALRAAGVTIETPFSHRLGYLLARAIDRAGTVDEGEPLPPLQDLGAQPNEFVRAMELYGMPLAKNVDEGTLDAVPELTNREMRLDEAEACEYWPLAWTHIGDNDGDKVEQCVAALESGRPFALAIQAGPRFAACDGSTLLQSDGRSPNHMIHCLDVAKAADGTWRFYIQNSHGIGWGAFGRAWAAQNVVANAFNILVPEVTV
jgi:hypothetical protein